MAKNLLKLALLASVVILSHQLLQLKEGHQLTLAQIQRDPFIEVALTSSGEMDGVRKQFLMVSVIQAKQRFASSKMVSIQEKVKKILRKYRLINNEDLLVMSNLRPVFLINSRKWSYSMIFAFAGEGPLVQACYKQLTEIGIMRIKSISTINFLNQKILSIDVFNKAKALLAKIIQKFSKIEMKSIEKLDIFGDAIKNQEIIEYQIKNEGMGTDLGLVQSEFAKIEHQQFNLIRRTNFGINVIFKMGNPFIQPEEDSEEYESDYSTENYSEDSYY